MWYIIIPLALLLLCALATLNLAVCALIVNRGGRLIVRQVAADYGLTIGQAIACKIYDPRWGTTHKLDTTHVLAYNWDTRRAVIRNRELITTP